MNKLYEKQSYLNNIPTVITSSFEENGKKYITLEDTIFFPEEGGQYADTGYLISGNTKINILDGQLHGEDIWYEVDSVVDAGNKVTAVLDWDKRFLRMQNHSGEHIISGLINKMYGLNNVGFHLSDDKPVTLDMDGVLTYEQVMEIEQIANSVIYKNMPITDTYPSKEGLGDISYRSKIEIAGQVRLITIGDETDTIDICACCAPHVKTTGEIGIIKVLSVTNYKKGIQISILCGKRALDYINLEHSILNNLAKDMSTHISNVPGLVASYREELQILKTELSNLKENQLINSISSSPVIFTDDNLTATNMKNIFNALSDRFTGYVGIFMGDDDNGYRYNAGSKSKDSVLLANIMREKLAAKGGGSGEMIQGRVIAKKEEIIKLFDSQNK